MNSVRCEYLDDGSRRYGDGPGFIFFYEQPFPDVFVTKGSSSERAALLKNIRITEKLSDLEMRRLPYRYVDPDSEGKSKKRSRALDEKSAIERVYEIIETRSDAARRTKIDELAADLWAASLLFHAPLAPNGDETKITDHKRFRTILKREAERLDKLNQPVPVPTKGQLRKAFNERYFDERGGEMEAANFTKLCVANGFAWLPTARPGAPKGKRL
jgi:hypothetical protein